MVNGDGSVYQEKSGLWAAALDFGTKPDGTRDRRVKRKRLKSEAQTELRNLRREKQDGATKATKLNVADYMRDWIENVDKSKPRTRAGYRSKIEQYIIPAIGNKRIAELTAAQVRLVEKHILAKNLSPTSATQTYWILSKALEDAKRERLIERNPADQIKPPVKATYNATVLDTKQASKVIGTVAKDRLGSRWAAALLTGMRQGEALGLELDRIDLGTGLIDLSWQLQRVNWRHGDNGACGKKRGTDCPVRVLDAAANWEHRHLTGGLYLARPKTKGSRRLIPLFPPLREIIERRIDASKHEPNPYGLLWTAEQKLSKANREMQPLDGSPIDPSRDNAAWHKVLERAKVPDMRLHDARHTAVTLLYDLGVGEHIIQQIAGQSTVSVTRGYRHQNIQPVFDALSQLGESLQLDA